jgi:hypothetical protein
VTRREVAEKIAEAIFVNGQGQKAERLVLTVDGPPQRDLGGWGFRPIIDQIEKVLADVEIS